jgi:hypothetical protein
VKRNSTAGADSILERIKRLETQLPAAPRNSGRRRALSVAIRIEADAYRKSLDAEQATATHDAKPQPAAGLEHLNRTSAPRKPTLARRRGIHRLVRSAPRR